MSRELQESTTVASLLDRIPTTASVKSGLLRRTDKDKQADLDYFKEIFADSDGSQLIGVTVYLLQVIKDQDPEAALFIMDEMSDIIKTELILKRMPATLKKFLYTVAGIEDDENGA